MRRTLLAFTVAGTVAAVGCLRLENRLVYHPTHTPEPSAQAGGFPLTGDPAGPRAYPVDFATADGTPIRGWWCPSPGATTAVLFCHGNAGDLNDWKPEAAGCVAGLGQSVLLFDYPGFGRSGGKPSEAGCYAAADAGYDWLAARGVPPERITVMGVSLGGGVAADVAARRPVRALVLVKTFTTLPDVASSLALGLPIQPLMFNRFDTVSKLGRVTTPAFVASATRDRLVPYRHGERLYAAANEPKYFYPIAGSRHGDHLEPAFFAALRGFLDAAAPIP